MRKLNRGMIVETALSCVGVPYLHQGRSRDGMDCVGLLVVIANEIGFEYVDYARYRRAARWTLLYVHLARNGFSPRSCGRELGDVVVMNMWVPGSRHVGVFCGDCVVHVNSARCVSTPIENIEPNIDEVLAWPR